MHEEPSTNVALWKASNIAESWRPVHVTSVRLTCPTYTMFPKICQRVKVCDLQSRKQEVHRGGIKVLILISNSLYND